MKRQEESSSEVIKLWVAFEEELKVVVSEKNTEI